MAQRSISLSTYASRSGQPYYIVALEFTFALEVLIPFLLDEVKVARLIITNVAFLLLLLLTKTPIWVLRDG